MLRWRGPQIAAVLGALWCCAYIGPLANPFSLDRVFHDDWAKDTMGWLFFRNEPFRFPLGQLRNFLHPLGTTLGYMDSIPWVALCLRPFSAILPTDFQYLGLWIIACSSALAFAAARVVARVTPHVEQQVLAGLLVAMSPCLIPRIIHPALCAHALIVAALGLALADAERPRRAVAWALGLTLLGAATHPYFAVMVLVLAVAVPVRHRAAIGPWAASAAVAGQIAGAVAVLYSLGYLGGDFETVIGGFGMYSANLNTFINAQGNSRLFPELPITAGQYEGYCYLGAGVFVLIASGLVLMASGRRRARLRSLPWHRAVWPALVASALAVFAVATPVRWNEQPLFEVAAYEPLQWLTQTFRSSGRFIWVLGYLIVLGVVVCVVRVWTGTRRGLGLLLAAAVVAQAYDLDFAAASRHLARGERAPFTAKAWTLAERDYAHLVFYPAEVLRVCEGPAGYRTLLVTELAYLAYRHRWTFNSGYAARVREATAASCKDLERRLAAGQFRADEIYVVAPDKLAGLQRAGAACGRLDGLDVCVQPRATRFANALRGLPDAAR